MKGEIMFDWGKASIVMSRLFVIVFIVFCIVYFIWTFK